MATFDFLHTIGSAIGSFVRLIGGKDPSGNSQALEVDALNQLKTKPDEIKATIGNPFITIGKPIVVSDALNNTRSLIVDNGGQLRVSSQPYSHTISEGDIVGHVTINKKARLITGSTLNQLFSNSIYTEQIIGAQRSIVSTSALDTIGGGGAEVIYIKYIRGDGTEGEEYITLNGLTAVNMIETNLQHVNFMEIVSPSNVVAIGNITLMTGINGIGTIITQILIGNMEYNTMLYYIPINKTLFIHTIFISSTDKGDMFIKKQITNGIYTYMKTILSFFADKAKTKPDNILIRVDGGKKIEIWFTPENTAETWDVYIEGWIE